MGGDPRAEEGRGGTSASGGPSGAWGAMEGAGGSCEDEAVSGTAADARAEEAEAIATSGLEADDGSTASSGAGGATGEGVNPDATSDALPASGACGDDASAESEVLWVLGSRATGEMPSRP